MADSVEKLLGLLTMLISAAGPALGFILGRRERAASAQKTEAEAARETAGIETDQAVAEKIRAETADIIAETYRDLIADMGAEIRQLRQLLQQERERREMETADLREQLQQERERREKEGAAMREQISQLTQRVADERGERLAMTVKVNAGLGKSAG